MAAEWTQVFPSVRGVFGETNSAALTMQAFVALKMRTICCAPSNAAVDVLMDKIVALDPSIKLRRFHSVGLERDKVFAMRKNIQSPDSDKSDAAEKAWLKLLQDTVLPVDSLWTIAKSRIPNFKTMSTYVRALERAEEMKELREPQSNWDERRMRAYEGNLLIGMVKNLKMEHKIDVEIRGNNEESSKQQLALAAENYGLPLVL